MKKIFLLPLYLGIIATLCGCSNNETNSKSITGTYYKTTNDNYFLKLYENGSCHFKNGPSSGYDTDKCSYDYMENELKLELVGALGDFTISCNLDTTNNTLDCDTHGSFKK